MDDEDSDEDGDGDDDDDDDGNLVKLLNFLFWYLSALSSHGCCGRRKDRVR